MSSGYITVRERLNQSNFTIYMFIWKCQPGRRVLNLFRRLSATSVVSTFGGISRLASEQLVSWLASGFQSPALRRRTSHLVGQPDCRDVSLFHNGNTEDRKWSSETVAVYKTCPVMWLVMALLQDVIPFVSLINEGQWQLIDCGQPSLLCILYEAFYNPTDRTTVCWHWRTAFPAAHLQTFFFLCIRSPFCTPVVSVAQLNLPVDSPSNS